MRAGGQHGSEHLNSGADGHHQWRDLLRAMVRIRTAGKEKLRCIVVLVHDRSQQRRDTFVGGLVHVRSCVEQHAHNSGLAVPGGGDQRRRTVSRTLAHTRTLVDQQANNFDLPLRGCQDQCRSVIAVTRANVRALHEQDPNDFRVPEQSRCKQRCSSILMFAINFDARRQRAADAIYIAIRRRTYQVEFSLARH
jgi:hypothetical protein